LISNNAFKEIKNKADKVRNIELCALLRHLGCTRDFKDKNKWHTSQGVLSVNGHKFMNWTLGAGGGGAIDLAMHLQRLDFKKAVIWLYDNFSSSLLSGSSPCKPSSVKQILKLPEKDDKKLSRVKQYLVIKRCLSEKLVTGLINSEKLYADIRGNAVFLLLGKKKKIVGAELRGTSNKKWRGMAQGSRKNLGCFYIIGRNLKEMILCESAIDAASCAVLYPEYTAISTSGATADPAWLQKLIINGCKIFCGFDADITGDAMANKMIKRHPCITRLRPPKHDWNDVLQALFS